MSSVRHRSGVGNQARDRNGPVLTTKEGILMPFNLPDLEWECQKCGCKFWCDIGDFCPECRGIDLILVREGKK